MARNNLGLALANLDETDQAVANWQSASDPATAHNNLAAVLMEKGNYPNARKELEIALSYNNAYPAALKNLELVSRLDGHRGHAGREAGRIALAALENRVSQAFRGTFGNSRTDPVKTASAP